MIAPVLHARPLMAPKTRMPTAIPEWQLRRVQRELDLCRRLMHANRKADAPERARLYIDDDALSDTGRGHREGRAANPDIYRPSAGAPLAFQALSDDRAP
jgi:hypothetical protein